MGNYWIDLNSRVPDEDETVKARLHQIRCEGWRYGGGSNFIFEEKFKLYREYPDNEMAKKVFADALYELAGMIVRHSNSLRILDFDDAVQEAVMVGWEKADRFCFEKGAKAFNYFTTCMMGHLRQVYRSQRHYRELNQNE